MSSKLKCLPQQLLCVHMTLLASPCSYTRSPLIMPNFSNIWKVSQLFCYKNTEIIKLNCYLCWWNSWSARHVQLFQILPVWTELFSRETYIVISNKEGLKLSKVLFFTYIIWIKSFYHNFQFITCDQFNIRGWFLVTVSLGTHYKLLNDALINIAFIRKCMTYVKNKYDSIKT